MNASLDRVEKYSAVPIHFGFEGQPKLPFQLIDHVFVDSLKGRLQTNNFLVWDRFAPQHAIEWFTSMDCALVHRFYAPSGSGQKEAQSKDLLHKIFICLRVIRPTRTPFAIVQFQLKENKEPDVFSFVEAPDPVSLALPESEVLNRLSSSDLVELKNLLPKFFEVDSAEGAQHIRRALRFFETGYAELKDPVLQFTVWMMGIESLFSFGEEAYDAAIVKRRIVEMIGDRDIYSEFAERDLYNAGPILVRDVLEDLFRMRNVLVHGRWVPNEWLAREVRSAISGPAINYADMLREAASFVLRSGILTSLASYQQVRE